MKTPNRVVRNYCFHCVGESSWDNVDSCPGVDLSGVRCAFHKYRLGKGRVSVKVFREFCLQCMNGDRNLIRTCTTIGCLVWPFRMGKNPNYSSNTVNNIIKNRAWPIHTG